MCVCVCVCVCVRACVHACMCILLKVLREDYDPEEYEDLEQYDAGTTVHLYSDSQPEGSNADGAVADGTKDIVQDVMTKTEL